MARRLLQRTAFGLACAVAAACVDRSAAAPEGAGEEAQVCAPAGAARPLAGVAEASGVALSRRTPGLLWSLNDSGQPLLFAFDASGQARGRVRIPNAAVEDWEDVTAAPCPGGHCLYVADIGDNDGVRRRIVVYRIPEPEPQDAESRPAEVFTATYPDGPRDAEALFVADGDLFILTKERAARLYRFPRPLKPGAEMRLERVAELPHRMVTDAEASPDGSWVAIRTNDELAFYRAAELLAGRAPAVTVPLRALQEPQGEGVALDGAGTVFLTSESGGGQRAGSLLTLRCTLPG